MTALPLILLLAAPSRAAFAWRAKPVAVEIPAATAAGAGVVRSLSVNAAGAYLVNGVKAVPLGEGNFKAVVMHPQAAELAVKVFQDRWANGVDEKERELGQIALLPPSAIPRVVEHGVTEVAGKPAAYLVQERVNGFTLKTPTPTKLAEVRALFERLAKARVEIADTRSADKLRANVMVGETASGGFGAYLVDPDVARTDKSDKELRAFYDGLLQRIVSGR